MPEPTSSPQPVPAEPVSAEPNPAPPPPRPAPALEPRQRWRAVFGRTVDAASQPHREVVEALEDALAASALPMLRDARRGGRPRLTFGAPLPIGMVVDQEQFDLWLTELRPLPEVREAVSAAFAPGYGLRDIYDVWLGALALPACVVGAEYLVEVATDLGLDDLRLAVTHVLAASRLPRERTKGSGVVAYDLRPLIAGIHAGRTPAGDLPAGSTPEPLGTTAGRTAPAGTGQVGGEPELLGTTSPGTVPNGTTSPGTVPIGTVPIATVPARMAPAGDTPLRTPPSATSTLRIQVRFDPALGSGRPEEVVAALAAVAGSTIDAVTTRRSRLTLAKNA